MRKERNHKHAAVRYRAFDTPHHNQAARNRRGHHAGAHHAQQVTRCNRNDPFGNHADPHRECRFQRLALRTGVFVTRQQERERNAERRDHRTNKLHRFRTVHTADQHAVSKQRHGFIHRSAEVECRHRTEDSAHQKAGSALHGLQQMNQRVLQPGYRLANQRHHQQAANDGTQYRQHHDGHQPLHRLWQTDIALK